MSTLSIYELVRRDLLHRESTDRASFGAPTEAYTGRAAILDAYDSAIDLACYLRRAIEDMTVGTGNLDVPDFGVGTPGDYRTDVRDNRTEVREGRRRTADDDVPDYGK